MSLAERMNSVSINICISNISCVLKKHNRSLKKLSHLNLGAQLLNINELNVRYEIINFILASRYNVKF